MSKNINLSPLRVAEKLQFLWRKFLKYSLFILIIAVFYFLYNKTSNVLPNNYILETFIINNGYSRNCLILDKSDINLNKGLYDFFVKNNSTTSVLPIFFTNLPSLINQADRETRRAIIINAVLPVLIEIKDQIKADRAKLFRINAKISKVPLTEEDFDTITTIASKYDVKLEGDNFWDYTEALENLIIRANIVPNSLILALIAYSTSDWGMNSEMILQNSLFTPSFFGNSENIIYIDNKPISSNSFGFPSIKEAIVSYYHELNTSPQYLNFRLSRARMGNDIESARLVYNLSSVTADAQFSSKLLLIMREDGLYKYDNLISISNKIENTCITIN